MKTLILSPTEIAARVTALGQQISQDYQGKPLMLVGVLNGAFIFLADLARALTIDVEIDFIRVASYGQSASSSGTIRLAKEVELDLTAKHIILVEDIIDTGSTMAWLIAYFANRPTASVRTCTLIDKKERRQVDITADYAGFTVPDGFLVGYGLDYAEQYRQLTGIYHLEPTAITS